MKLLVLGSAGQVAMHLREQLPEATFWGRNTLDLGRESSIASAIEEFAPSAIVNAAAYTAVDKAETERLPAWSVNASAPAAIAAAAQKLQIPLVHLSTDYVFDGQKSSDYRTDDLVNPMSTYGLTKLGGELAVRALCSRSWILRTSWVFSEHGHNFVRTILRLAATRDALRVVADQVGRPTYAGDLAVAIARIVARAGSEGTGGSVTYGLYNATGGPVVSWHAFATEIVQRAHDLGMLRTRVPIAPITTAEYPLPARRPANSALMPSEEVAGAIGVKFDWQSGLQRMLEKLAAQDSASSP